MKAMRSFDEVVNEFQASCVRSFNNQGQPILSAQALTPEDVAPLLGFVAGVLRAIVQEQTHVLPGGSTNPWYALGLRLASMYGLTTSDLILTFGVSDFDRTTGIEPVVISCRHGSSPGSQAQN